MQQLLGTAIARGEIDERSIGRSSPCFAITLRPDLTACERGADNRALKTIAEQPGVAVDYIASFLDRLTRDEVHEYYERYIGPYFTPDGQVDLAIAQQGIDAVAAEPGLASVAADEMYQPISCAAAWNRSLGRAIRLCPLPSRLVSTSGTAIGTRLRGPHTTAVENGRGALPR